LIRRQPPPEIVKNDAAAALTPRQAVAASVFISPGAPMSSIAIPASVAPILLLTISNIFMTFAWYGHLNYKSWPLWLVVIASWGIAFFEYCFAVPANRIGHEVYSAAELKTIQEVITLTVFAGF